MTPEGEVKKHLNEELASIGIFKFRDAVKAYKAKHVLHGYYFMPAATGMGEAGVADYVLCLLGKYVEIEVKADKEPSKLQQLHGDVINHAMGDWYVVRDKKEVDKLILHFKNIIVQIMTTIEVTKMMEGVELMEQKTKGVTH